MVESERSAWELENFSNAYRVWLSDKMGADRYLILFDILYETEFLVLLEDDENRAWWGRDLRRRFSEESGLPYPETDEQPCSFLEMLIGLSYSLEEQVLYDNVYGDRTATWFWMMMSNLGLDICDDEWMLFEPGSFWKVDQIIHTVMARDYDWSGAGGIFPLMHAKEDQRKVPLWYQAHAFIIEKNVA